MMFETKEGLYKYFYFDEDLTECDKSTFFDTDSLKSYQKLNDKGGRGSAYCFTKDNKSLVYREYIRGGLLGKIIKRHFFKYDKYAHRAKDELCLLEYMHQNNLNVPKPYIARETDSFLFIKQEIVIYKIEAINLFEYLKNNDFSKEICNLIFIELKKLFKFNIFHSDLNIRNILIDDNNKVYIIDFDKCYKKDLQEKDIAKMLDRLLRSFEKEKKLYNINFDQDLFLNLRRSSGL